MEPRGPERQLWKTQRQIEGAETFPAGITPGKLGPLPTRGRRMIVRRRLSIARAVSAAAVLALALVPQLRAQSAESHSARCGVAEVPSDFGIYLPLPRGDVFCPLIADPKTTRSFATYQRGNESDLATDIAAVGIADQFPFFRAAAGRGDNGIQLGIAGAVFAQFDVGSPSYDLLNADYLIGLPLTFRAGPVSGRVRVYHQSSHLGDELLLRPNPPKRENLSFESVEGLLSIDVFALRLYGGGESFVRRDSSDLPEKLWHGGAELRPRAAVTLGPLAALRLVGAADAKVVRDSVTRTGISVRAGFEVARPNEAELGSRRWSLLAEYYDGPSPYGQFQRHQVRLTGIGMYFTL
jgi:Protein of unknown function (DUF1207)